MAVFRLFRAYHAALAVLSILAYLTGEAGLIHAWLGYAVAAVIVFRLGWSVVGPRHLGISRIFPDLEALRGIRWIDHPAVGKVLLSGIAINLLLATVTGLALDHRPRRGEAALMGTALADGGERRGGREREREDGVLEAIHETTAELLFVFVIGHAGFVLLFRRPLARYMLFLAPPPAAPRRRPSDRP